MMPYCAGHFEHICAPGFTLGENSNSPGYNSNDGKPVMSVITSVCSKTFLATVSALVMVAGMVVAFPPAAQANPAGVTWTSQTSAADNRWTSVTYGNGLFVAVSFDGTGNREIGRAHV